MSTSASMRRGRSPARSTINRTPTKSGTANSSISRGPSGTAGTRSTPRNAKNQPTREVRLKNTPEHLYGVDKADEIYDDTEFRKSGENGSLPGTREMAGIGLKSNWADISWVKIAALVITIFIGLQAFLYFRGKDYRFDNLDLGSDASICLRSHEELRKKLAMAFELLNESGKLFKQLERQTKFEFEKLDVKHESLDAKTFAALEAMKRQIEALRVTHSQRDNVDFSKYSDKELPVDLSEIHSLVEMALLQYDADKIGIPDYALESAGGRIHVPYHSPTHSSGWPIMKVFGMVLWQDTRTPREVIKPEALPGNCWPFKGASGYVVIKLAYPIIPTMITMEHLHPALAKFNDDALQSMPKNFSVFAWVDEQGKEKVLLGSYTYIQLSKARQTFPIQDVPEEPTEYVELSIENNYGNPTYTCIYRFRVHGNPLQAGDPE